MLILDGFDEAGELEEKLHDEITRIYIHRLVSGHHDARHGGDQQLAGVCRLDVIPRKDLSEDQRRQVVVKQLGEAVGEKLLGQLKLNPALAQMAVNPLLLNVTITVFKSGHVGESLGGLNRLLDCARFDAEQSRWPGLAALGAAHAPAIVQP